MSTRTHLPTFLIAIWWAGFATGGALWLETLWGHTLLTWERGPQAIGDTLWHVYPEFALVGTSGYLLMFGWLVAATAFFAWRRKLPTISGLVYLGLPLLATVLSYVPYSFWAGLGGVKL